LNQFPKNFAESLTFNNPSRVLKFLNYDEIFTEEEKKEKDFYQNSDLKIKNNKSYEDYMKELRTNIEKYNKIISLLQNKSQAHKQIEKLRKEIILEKDITIELPLTPLERKIMKMAFKYKELHKDEYKLIINMPRKSKNNKIAPQQENNQSTLSEPLTFNQIKELLRKVAKKLSLLSGFLLV